MSETLFNQERYETYAAGFAVVETGVRAPSDSLVTREDTRSLSFEEEKTLGKSLAVIMTGESYRKTEKQ